MSAVFTLSTLPPGWNYTKLGDVVDFQGGAQPPKSEFRYEPSGDCVRFIQIRDFKSDKFKTYIPRRLARRLFDEQDIMIGRYGPPVFQILRGLSGSYNVALMKATPNELMERRYLFHLLQDSALQHYIIENSERTAGQTGVNLHLLLDITIPLPPISEQRRIADVLDRAEALRAKRRAALAELDGLDDAVFVELFGDPVTNPQNWDTSFTLGDVAEIISGITKGRKLANVPTREVPYLAVVNVQDRALNLDVVKYIEATEEEIRRYRLAVGDIILTEGGDPDKLGRGTIWDGDIEECIHQNHIFRARINTPIIEPFFASRLIASNRGKNYFLKAAKQTTGIASINMTQLRRFPLFIPPLELQQEFARRVAAVEKLKAVQRASLAELDALFASLQDRAFRGAL